MLVIGLDEAGYGPLLGPLVVAGAAFRVTDPETLPDVPGARALLLAALDGSVRHRRESRGAAASERAASDAVLDIADSKRLLGAGRDIASLELPVLAFLAAPRPTDPGSGAPWLGGVEAVLDAVGCGSVHSSATPWYDPTELALPRRADPAALGAAGQTLRDTLHARGAEFVAFAAEVVPEDRLNASLRLTENKAQTLFDVNADIVERLLALRREDERAVVVFDRHGGRRFYAPMLQDRWPEAFVWTLGEKRERSIYRVAAGGPLGAETLLAFQVKADDQEPQVALASMLAKYLREVHMELWNRWFHTLCPDVRPTAGYVQDARRWLAATREARDAAGVPDARLVRIR